MKVVTLSIFLLSFVPSFSNETSRVDDLLERAVGVFADDKELAFKLEIEALELSIELDYLPGIARSNFYLGYYFEYHKNYSESIGHYLDVIHSESSQSDSLSMIWRIKANRNLGNIFLDHEVYDLAREFYEKGILLSQEIKDKKQEMSILHNLYISTYEADELGQSEDALLKLRNLAENYSKEHFRSLNGLAQLSFLRRDYPAAEQQALDLLSISLEQNNTRNLSYAYHNLGDIYSSTGQESKSVSHFLKAIEVKKELNSSNTYSLFLSYQNLGDLYLSHDEFAKALVNYTLALKLVDGIKNHPDYFYIFESLGKVHSSMGNLKDADLSRSKFVEELDLYTQAQAEINSASQQFNMRQIVSSYYEELEAQRKAEQTKTMFLAIIVGLSTMLFLFVSYHFASRYHIKRRLTQELESLTWID